jgi:septal ring factor EnvC (AmiA/AmiB activator)
MKMKKIFSLLLILGLLIMPVRKCSAAKTVAELKNDLQSVQAEIDRVSREVDSTDDTEQLAELGTILDNLELYRNNLEEELEAAPHNGPETWTGVGTMVVGMVGIDGVGVIIENGQKHCLLL